jgi:hypothetical protein
MTGERAELGGAPGIVGVRDRRVVEGGGDVLVGVCVDGGAVRGAAEPTGGDVRWRGVETVGGVEREGSVGRPALWREGEEVVGGAVDLCGMPGGVVERDGVGGGLTRWREGGEVVGGVEAAGGGAVVLGAATGGGAVL